MANFQFIYDEEEKSAKFKSRIVTFGITLLLLLGLFFFKMNQSGKEMVKYDEIGIDFGTDDNGQGLEEPKENSEPSKKPEEPKKEEIQPEKTENSPKIIEEKIKSVEKIKEPKEILTENSKEKVPIVKTKEVKNPKKEREEKDLKELKEAKEIIKAKELKRANELKEAKELKKAKEIKDATDSKKVKEAKKDSKTSNSSSNSNNSPDNKGKSLADLLVKGKGKGNSTSQGNGSGKGNSGDPKASTEGKGNSIGNGAGQRKLVGFIPGTFGRSSEPNPDHNCGNEHGTVVVAYTVNKNGSVTNAEFKSGNASSCVINTAISWVKKYVKAEAGETEASSTYKVEF